MLHVWRPLAALSSLVVYAFLAAPAVAAGSNMPWEQPLNQILESIQGPVAKVMPTVTIMPSSGLTRRSMFKSSASKEFQPTYQRARGLTFLSFFNTNKHFLHLMEATAACQKCF